IHRICNPHDRRRAAVDPTEVDGAREIIFGIAPPDDLPAHQRIKVTKQRCVVTIWSLWHDRPLGSSELPGESVATAANRQLRLHREARKVAVTRRIILRRIEVTSSSALEVNPHDAAHDWRARKAQRCSVLGPALLRGAIADFRGAYRRGAPA